MKVVRLDEVCNFLSGFAWSSKKFNMSQTDNSMPIIRIQNLSPENKEFVYWNDEYQEKYVIKNKDLLLSMSGNIKLYYWDKGPALLNQRIVKIVPNENLNERYLFHVLQSLTGNIEKLGKKSIINNVSISDLKNLEVNLPSLENQQKIVEILDKAEGLIKIREISLVTINKLKDSLFINFFGDLIENYPNAKLAEISEVVSGVTKGKKNNGPTITLPYMRVANVQDGYLDLNEIKEIEVTLVDSEKYKLEYGDVLLTEGGDPDKLGRGSVWRNEIPNCIHQNHIFRVRLNKELINPEYFSKYAGSKYGKSYFLKSGKQTTGIASINSTQLKNFPVPIPPMELQERFESVCFKIECRVVELNKSLKGLHELYNSLLDRALKGELTKQKVR
ncbi:restriction endonuclease subunit S [Bacillus sp. ISL-46]|uniref:restriction endonuclease subunit S n=1 Tax=Bacillus sp. ISL-46 TaxID=2819129 RepID=UPI001BECF05D|nr:restriction endonuclease subunit S [Bacillus sp. ISL-46]MBT2721461.1 restriction endonuclease subunit S [Bacillus sp. ISL-46]